MSTVATAAQEAPVRTPVKKMTPQEELKYLEGKAIEYGISTEQLHKIRIMGQCPKQVQDRIKVFRDFIAARGG